VGLRLLDDTRFAINIYARLNTVVPWGGGLAQMDASGQGYTPRPLSLHFQMTDAPEVTFRLRSPGHGPAYRQMGAFRMDYLVDPESAGTPDTRSLSEAEEVAEAAIGDDTPDKPMAVLTCLRRHPMVAKAWLAPEPRGGQANGDIRAHESGQPEPE